MIRRSVTATAFTAAVLGAVLAPVVRNLADGPRDDFPLSHYPMFSSKRGRTMCVTHLRGVTATGAPVSLPAGLVARGGMNQARKLVRDAARRGEADRFAAAAARRVARTRRYRTVAEVQVVTSRFRLRDWERSAVDGPARPVDVRIRGTATVPRDPAVADARVAAVRGGSP